MEYLPLIYSNPDAWDGMSAAEQAAAYEGYVTVARDAEAAGVLVDAKSMPRWTALFEEIGKADPDVIGRELGRASEAMVIRVVDGETIVTDGPFANTKEQLGGMFIAELSDLDEAIRIAALVPTAASGTLEIRPLATR